MNIAFWDNSLCERGSTLGLYNYAYYNEKLLNNKSYIFYDKNQISNVGIIIEKFKKQFIVHETDDFKEVDNYLLKYNITHIFIIKSGKIDSRLSKVAKNCIQCVFTCLQPHGEVYCSISPWVTGNNGKFPVIPRIITLPKHSNNLRDKLKIPTDAVVFGGYGGSKSFNISYVYKVVHEIASNNPNIYFLFANFIKFCPAVKNIIHLPMIVDLHKKVEFINTCDAMLWARIDGETFGQSIAEFSINNKPVIATKEVIETTFGIANSHVRYLGAKAKWYSNATDLKEILLGFDPKLESKKDWNAYRDYTPEKVMNIFNEVFLKHRGFNIQELPSISEDEKLQIARTRGLMTKNQYELIYKIIKSRAPCNVLIFGLGQDSYLWNSVNKGGETVFIENIKSWSEKFPDLEVINVTYNTTVLDFPHNLRNEKLLLLDLPERIKNTKWDIIIVDSPVGHNPPCVGGKCQLCSPTNPAPGRMSSLYTSSKLAQTNSIIIIDDYNRQIEQECTRLYFCDKYKINYNDSKLVILAN